LHVVAGSAMLARVIPALHDTLETSGASAHALSLEPALRRFAVLLSALPPVAAGITGIAVWSVIGQARGKPVVARWLAIGCVPLALDGVLRAVAAWRAPDPRVAADVLGWLLQAPLALGALFPRAGSGWAAWVGDLSLLSVGAVGAFAMALANAGDAPRASRERPRRETASALLAVGAAYLSAVAAVQVLFPLASQRVLLMAG
jgi:hypothetical protein